MSNGSRADEWKQCTYIVRKEMDEKLRNFAYTERLSIKEALDMALRAFFGRQSCTSKEKIRWVIVIMSERYVPITGVIEPTKFNAKA